MPLLARSAVIKEAMMRRWLPMLVALSIAVLLAVSMMLPPRSAAEPAPQLTTTPQRTALVHLPVIQKPGPAAAPSPDETATAAATLTPTIIAPPTPSLTPTATPTHSANCDPSYPTVCIPPPPPDLNCSDIPYRNFVVLPPDPHHFDADHDGIGCES
jgi:hypothetical protein